MSDAPRIIGLAGKAGSGKDTVADYIAEAIPPRTVEVPAGPADYNVHLEPDAIAYARKPDTTRILFAEPIKEAALVMFKAYGVTRGDVYGPSELRGKQIGNLIRNDGQPLTIRYVLQTLGTQWGRQLCYDHIWIDLALQRARVTDAQVVVITDCRFNNEFIALRDAGGEVWHIERPGAGLAGDAGTHESERDLDGPILPTMRTRVIDNSGTLDDLRVNVARALQG